MHTTDSYFKSNTPVPKVQYENIDLAGKPIVYLSKTVWDKIQFLCSQISQVEWSGCIFYRFLYEKATLSDPTTLNIEVVDIIPLDKGTAGFTEYNFDGRVLDYMTKMDYFDLKIGHCHSHHSMKTFFSGTDMSELNDNSEHIKPYLSLIVNNHKEFSCKLAFRIDAQPAVYQFQDINGEINTMQSVSTKINVASYNCNVEIPIPKFEVSPLFMEQFQEIMKSKPVLQPVKYQSQLVKPKVKDDTQELFDWLDSINTSGPIDSPFDEEKDDSPTLKELEDMSCFILRLGNKVPNDTLEIMLEDLERSMIEDDFDFEKYCDKIASNIDEYIKLFWNMPDMDEETIIAFQMDFVDELLFMQDEFPFVSSIILKFENPELQ